MSIQAHPIGPRLSDEPDRQSIGGLPRRDRLVVLAGLTGIVSLAWTYLYVSVVEMNTMMALKPWTSLDFTLMFLMWAVMMVAMMVPSVTSVVLLYAAALRRVTPRQHYGASVGGFVLGYVIAWSVFSLGATALQWALEQQLSPMMTSSTALFGGVLLIAAGAYQWTPAKDACLEHCRMPLEFIARYWSAGPSGAIWMGTVHGFYCLGCCWAIMGLLFVGGVMNLLWVAVIAIFILLEKVAPMGSIFGRRLSGLGLIVTGLLFIVWFQ